MLVTEIFGCISHNQWQARPIHRQYPELSDLAVNTALPQGTPTW
jgi:hypothetical protein